MKILYMNCLILRNERGLLANVSSFKYGTKADFPSLLELPLVYILNIMRFKFEREIN